MDANRTAPGYELKNELARYCLPPANRDRNQRLAWVNSVCILFLLIGIFGARRGVVAIKPVPPIREEVPVVVQPTVLPPQTTPERKAQMSQPNNQPRVLVALPNAPNVNFGVPTAGTLVADAALASAPQVIPVRIGSLFNTGAGGERPEPPYPPIALQTGEQGTVVLVLNGDDAGNVISVDVKESSGFPLLDRATVDFIKRHWRLPTDSSTRLFQTSITYRLQLN
ncbi:MAG TPA: TonB family protein [Candidatus Limnocylindrales bacterium]|nr:TonB family protein [Candidatus Limnocylindrales bacterium]